MLALTVQPRTPDSARVEEVPAPKRDASQLLIEMLALGICGTDREIIAGEYGSAPSGHSRLVLGHESLGRIVEAPAGSPFAVGDHVVAMVRHPDPVPCANCAVGEWDMCSNGRYTEHGIKDRDGFATQRLQLPADRLVRVDEALGIAGVLLEPASVVVKAWSHVEHIGRRAHWNPKRVLVTGAGPIGLIAALVGAQRKLELHVIDRVSSGIKPDLVRALGGTYHTDLNALDMEFDVVLECTGATPVILDVLGRTRRNGIVCLTGVSHGGSSTRIDLGALNRGIVLENDVIFGSVNANRRHYEDAAAMLMQANRGWLKRLITRRVPLDRWREALERHDDDVKVVLEFGSSSTPS